jgi:hypothetical protein
MTSTKKFRIVQANQLATHISGIIWRMDRGFLRHWYLDGWPSRYILERRKRDTS